MGTVFLPTHTDIDYRPAGTNNSKQYLDIYYPTIGTAPYPVMVHFRFAGFVSSSREGSLESGVEVLGTALEAGWAAVDVEVTTAGPSSPGVGGGMFRHPTTDAEWDIEGGGDDFAFLDATWVIQWIRENAVTYNFDTTKIVPVGRSAGSQCATWVALGEDWATPGSSITQCQQSSRTAGLVVSSTQIWWHAYVQTAGVNGFPSLQWLRASSDDTQPCVNLSAATTGHKNRASTSYGLSSLADMFDENAQVPVYAVCAGEEIKATIGAYDWTFNTTSFAPAMAGTSSTGLCDEHHPWASIMLMKILRYQSPFHNTHSRFTVEQVWEGEFADQITPEAIMPGELENGTTQADIVSWMDKEFLSLGGVASLNLRMDWANEVKVSTQGITTSKAGGMIKRRQTNSAYSRNTGDNATRRYIIQWKAASRVEHDIVLDAWNSSLGGTLPINFTPPDENVILARFLGGKFTTRQDGPNRFAMSCELEEVI